MPERTLQHQKFEQHPVVVLRDTPLTVVIEDG